MGTNYYWINQKDINPEHHIGKSSMAGLYCYECGCTLCSSGTHDVHNGKAIFHDECPSCKTDTHVKPTMSFVWTKMKHLQTIKSHLKQNFISLDTTDESYGQPIIVDEYGITYTAEAFLQEVYQYCKIIQQDYCEFS